MKRISLVLIALVALALVLDSCKKDEEETKCETPVAGPTPYDLVIPPFFPPMDIPADNPLTVEGVELGRHLFWDTRLSGDNTQSCGSCHLPSAAFSDPNQFSTGITGEQGNRQAMAIINLGWGSDFFWDGRAATIEEQVAGPVENPIEMNDDWDDVVDELQETEMYPPMFQAAWGTDQITKDLAVKSLAQFVRTIISADSKFDRERLGQYEFTEPEARGLDLFLKEGGDPDNGQGGQWGADCFHCHGFGAMLFTDNQPHNNGLDSIFTDLGYGEVSGDPQDFGLFKTTTLRNVALSGPYMHDGRFTTLMEVVNHYNSGGHPSPTIDPFMKYVDGGLQLSEQDKTDIIAFLHCLTDTSFINNPAYQDPF
jgi:cytochrome c peroxidase